MSAINSLNSIILLYTLRNFTDITISTDTFLILILYVLLKLWNRGQDTKYRGGIQNTGYRIQNTGDRIQNTVYGLQNTGYGIQDPSPGYRI